MKITQIIFLFFFISVDSYSQQTRELLPLDNQDFKCLQSIECIENSQSLKQKGWSFIYDKTVDEFTRELTAIMKGENIYFFAIYDIEGSLIRSTYKRKNVPLPSCLLTYFSQGNYKEWQITGSEMVIRDFDPATINYKVELKNKKSSTSEKYDFDFISGLHLKYEKLARHCMLQYCKK
jgi:hypothetical protein